MRKVFLTLLFPLFLAGPALAQQVCMSAPDLGPVCLTISGTLPCESGYAATTLVTQATDFQVILAGTPVCVLRVVPGSQLKGDPLVAVISKMALATPNGATQVVTRESVFYSSQLSGAGQSMAISVAQ